MSPLLDESPSVEILAIPHKLTSTLWGLAGIVSAASLVLAAALDNLHKYEAKSILLHFWLK